MSKSRPDPFFEKQKCYNNIMIKKELTPLKIGKTTFDFSRTYLMGILNLTPDSFSDGALYNDPSKAMKRIEQLISEGADIIDIGAESSRPGAASISAQEEIDRLSPILAKYYTYFSAPLSLDTTKSAIRWTESLSTTLSC